MYDGLLSLHTANCCLTCVALQMNKDLLAALAEVTNAAGEHSSLLEQTVREAGFRLPNV